MCNDDDARREEEAVKAAELVNGRVVLSVFNERRSEKDKDFNDIARLNGLDKVKDVINAACVASKTTAPLPLLDSFPPVTPPFDPAVMLPSAIRDFAIDASSRQQSPANFIAFTGLSELSTVLGVQILMLPKQNHD